MKFHFKIDVKSEHSPFVVDDVFLGDSFRSRIDNFGSKRANLSNDGNTAGVLRVNVNEVGRLSSAPKTRESNIARLSREIWIINKRRRQKPLCHLRRRLQKGCCWVQAEGGRRRKVQGNTRDCLWLNLNKIKNWPTFPPNLRRFLQKKARKSRTWNGQSIKH